MVDTESSRTLDEYGMSEKQVARWREPKLATEILQPVAKNLYTQVTAYAKTLPGKRGKSHRGDDVVSIDSNGTTYVFEATPRKAELRWSDTSQVSHTIKIGVGEQKDKYLNKVYYRTYDPNAGSSEERYIDYENTRTAVEKIVSAIDGKPVDINEPSPPGVLSGRERLRNYIIKRLGGTPPEMRPRIEAQGTPRGRSSQDTQTQPISDNVKDHLGKSLPGDDINSTSS